MYCREAPNPPRTLWQDRDAGELLESHENAAVVFYESAL
jgi:hypothetical protein